MGRVSILYILYFIFFFCVFLYVDRGGTNV